MTGLLVTGTDTGVGKTILSAALVAAIAAEGEPVRAHKPVLTGLEEEDATWPADHALLGAVAHMPPEEVAPLRFRRALAPHLAASLEHRALTAERVVSNALAAREHAASSGAMLIVEGVGGLLCPLSDHLSVADLAAELGFRIVIAARAGLGTINHTLLTLEAARWRGLEVSSVVLTPWSQTPSAMELSNRETIARLGRVEVATLDAIEAPSAGALARAGARLPWRSWLASPPAKRGELAESATRRRGRLRARATHGAQPRSAAPAPTEARTAASTPSLRVASSSSSMT
jgi:dethiobiotin synthetase